MSINAICLRLLLPLWLLAFLTSVLRADPLGLTVVAGPGTVIDGPASAHYDFGTRRLSEETPLVHVFVLRNPASVPIVIDRLQTSCGCTTAVAGASDVLPLTVPPGRTVPIRLQLMPRRLLPGEAHKSVWVYTHGTGDATTLLEMRGTVQDDSAPEALQASVVTTAAAGAPTIGSAAPSFTSADTLGRTFTLSAKHGHPIALFFFCGCPWCADVAHLWGRAQRLGQVPAGTQTVIVFAGGPAAAKMFAADNHLERSRTTLLPDADGRLTESLYKVSACPRVFALNASGTVVYTNTHPDDQPRQAPAQTLVSRVLKSPSKKP